jgi:hypothetical protein
LEKLCEWHWATQKELLKESRREIDWWVSQWVQRKDAMKEIH